LVDRHARRTVVLEHSEHTTAFLRRRRHYRVVWRVVWGGGRLIKSGHTGRDDYRYDNRPQNNADRYLLETHVLPMPPRCPACNCIDAATRSQVSRTACAFATIASSSPEPSISASSLRRN